ncbi:kinase-like domain-containing protein [Aspergillus germanicus]
MPRLPDLVRDYQLEASFPPDRPDDTVHTYHERAPRLRRRLTRTEHWTRLRRIGHGGFARVYLEECSNPRATDKPRFRAVKKINIDKWSAHIDYTRELEAISKFSQPKYDHSFVKSYGWFKTSRHLFIAMEYLELGDLHNYLYHQRQKPLPEHEAQDVIYQILYGLQEMHENDFIHRDLKLNNISKLARPRIPGL